MGLGFRVEAQRRLREGSERSRMAPRGSEKAQRRLRGVTEKAQRRPREAQRRLREGTERPSKVKKGNLEFWVGTRFEVKG